MSSTRRQIAKPAETAVRPVPAAEAELSPAAVETPAVHRPRQIEVPANVALVQYVGPASEAIHPQLGGVIRGGVYTCRLRLAVELLAGAGFEPWSETDRSKIEQYAQERSDR